MRYQIISVVLGLFLMQQAFAINDPMRPPVSVTGSGKMKTSPVWVLNSVLTSNQRKVAIINQIPVLVGESVNGARVMSIRDDRVLMSQDGKQFEIKLYSARVKRPVAGKQ
jgi:type II secretory pathway component PulC